jgi:hypothetical protein
LRDKLYNRRNHKGGVVVVATISEKAYLFYNGGGGAAAVGVCVSAGDDGNAVHPAEESHVGELEMRCRNE